MKFGLFPSLSDGFKDQPFPKSLTGRSESFSSVEAAWAAREHLGKNVAKREGVFGDSSGTKGRTG